MFLLTKKLFLRILSALPKNYGSPDMSQRATSHFCVRQGFMTKDFTISEPLHKVRVQIAVNVVNPDDVHVLVSKAQGCKAQQELQGLFHG